MARTSEFRSGAFSRKRYLLLPLLFCVAVFAVAFGAIAYVTTYSAGQLDAAAQAKARQLMATALQGLRDDIDGRLYDYAWWDGMVAQAETGVDHDWADTTIGAYMRTDFGHLGTFVLDPEYRTIFGENGDPDLPVDVLTFLGPQAGPLLAKVQDQPMTESYPMSGFVLVQDRLFLVSAAAIMPEYPTGADLVPANRPVLIFHRELDSDLLGEVSDRYVLASLAVHPSAPVEGAFPIPGFDGAPVAWATWTDPSPGEALVDELLPTLFVATAFLLLATATIYSLWFRTALAANKAKTAFFAKMTHELRTPLNPILGFSDIMRRELMGPIPERYRAYADDIHRSGSHLKQLIDDVLDVSKLEADGAELRPTVVDVSRVLDDVAGWPLPDLDGERKADTGIGLSFRRDVATDLPRLKVDELRLRQILINLLSNAAKHGAAEDIVVRAATDGDGAVRIDVEDRGPGIPKEDLERVFEPFAQARDGTPEKASGTGLGLGIARDLMRLHGGNLTLTSELGVGTTASLVFPRHRSVAARAGGD